MTTTTQVLELMVLVRSDWVVYAEPSVIGFKPHSESRAHRLMYASCEEIMDGWAYWCVGERRPPHATSVMECSDWHYKPPVDTGKLRADWRGYVASALYWLSAICKNKMAVLPPPDAYPAPLTMVDECLLNNLMHYMHIVVMKLTMDIRLSSSSTTAIRIEMPAMPGCAAMLVPTMSALLLQPPPPPTARAAVVAAPAAAAAVAQCSRATSAQVRVGSDALREAATRNNWESGCQRVKLWLKESDCCACCGMSDPEQCKRRQGSLPKPTMVKLVRDLAFMGYHVQHKPNDADYVNVNRPLLDRVYGACRVIKLDVVLTALHGPNAVKRDYRSKQRAETGSAQNFRATAPELTDYLALVRSQHDELRNLNADGMLDLFQQVCQDLK